MLCTWLRIVELIDVDACGMQERAGRCEAIERGQEEPPPGPGECPQAFFRVRDDGRVELTDTPLVPPVSIADDKWRTCSASEPPCVCACDPGLPAG